MVRDVENGDDNSFRMYYIICSILAIVVTMIYINYMNYALDSLHILERTDWPPLHIYWSGMGIFFALFVFFIGSFALVNKKKPPSVSKISLPLHHFRGLTRKKQWLVVMSLTLMGFILLSQYMFVGQWHEFGFNEGNYYGLPAVIWRVVGILTMFFVAYMIVKKHDIDNVVKYSAYVVSILVSFINVFITNPFVEGISQGYEIGFSNFNVTWTTIYNVIDGVPFTLDTTPLYGHYGLFFLPVKLFGSLQSINAISFIFALMACVEQIAILYVIDTFAPRKWIGMLLAVGSVVRLTWYQVQLMPIRTLFPVLLFAFFIYLYKRKKDIRTGFGYGVTFLILTLSVIFNLEMGICCIVGFCSYIVFELIYEQTIFHIEMAEVCRAILISVLAIVLAVCIVNIYNLICGGPIIWDAFFFPLIGGDTHILKYLQENYHNWIIPIGNSAWEYVLIFLLGTFCMVCFKVTTDNKKNYQFSIIPTIGGMTCLELAAFSYYMNEPIWVDLMVYRHVIYGLFSIFLGKIYRMIEQDKYPHIGDQFVRAVGLLMICVVVFGAIQIINDPVRVAGRRWAGAYDTEKMKDQIAKIDITEDVYGFGFGVNMIYHMKGIDNHMKYRNISALHIPYSKTFSKVVDELRQKEIVFAPISNAYDKGFLDMLQTKGFTIMPIKSYQVGDQKYGLCSIKYNSL